MTCDESYRWDKVGTNHRGEWNRKPEPEPPAAPAARRSARADPRAAAGTEGAQGTGRIRPAGAGTGHPREPVVLGAMARRGDVDPAGRRGGARPAVPCGRAPL